MDLRHGFSAWIFGTGSGMDFRSGFSEVDFRSGFAQMDFDMGFGWIWPWIFQVEGMDFRMDFKMDFEMDFEVDFGWIFTWHENKPKRY